MAEEHASMVPECESNVGGEGTVETKDRGLFDFMGKKEEEKSQEEVIATEFDEKDKIEEEHKEGEEKKKHSLLEKLHRSDSSSSSFSDEEEGKGEVRRCSKEIRKKRSKYANWTRPKVHHVV
ncbi:hypothetical protein REPUB_Repub10bG0093100 [Reevesia pubescens]